MANGAHTTRVSVGLQGRLNVVLSSPLCCFLSRAGLQFEISLLQLILRQCGKEPRAGEDAVEAVCEVRWLHGKKNMSGLKVEAVLSLGWNESSFK